MLAEYLLISETSAVTMTIAGVIKEVVTIVVRLLYSSLSVVLGLLTTATLYLLNQQWTLHFLHMFSTYVQCELRAPHAGGILSFNHHCLIWYIYYTWIAGNLGLTKIPTQ